MEIREKLSRLQAIDRINAERAAEGQTLIVMTVSRMAAQMMADGRKIVELRKTWPGKPGPLLVAMCDDAGQIIGQCVVRGILDLTHLDQAIVARLANVPVDAIPRYRRYGQEGLYGWVIEQYRDLSGTGLSVEDYGVTSAPRSWCYGHVD